MNLYVWTAKIMKDVDCAKNMVNVLKIFFVAMIAKNINKKHNIHTPKYEHICDITGIKPDYKRMSVVKGVK